MMTNFQLPPTAVSALHDPPPRRLHDPRKILLAVVRAASIAFAAALFAAASGIGGADQSASAVGIHSASAYHYARVLEPGSRGSVVEV
jgi:hypothetical protein